MANQTNRPPLSPTLVATLVTVTALTITILHVGYPGLGIDSIALALVALAALPWLGTVLESLEGPGGWKVKYRQLERQVQDVKGTTLELEREVQDVKGTASTAVETVDTALEDLQDRRHLFKGEELGYSMEPESTAIQPSPDEDLRLLSAEYNDIRAMQPPGFERTAAMTAVIGKMRALLRRASRFDWEQSLKSRDRGTRLAAYAYLYERPTCRAASPLVYTLTRLEDKPFGQYWAVQALRPVLEECDVAERRNLEDGLRRFATRLSPGTDRHVELMRLLHDFYGANQNALSEP